MKVFILVERDKNGFFVAEAPTMPGCFSTGRTHDEALASMHQVIQEWLEALNGKNIEDRSFHC